MRISMHPDQFTVINSKDPRIVKNSVRELKYHREFLDAMKLGENAKVQIHVGGVYGEKGVSIERFIKNYKKLPQKIRNRLTIENDDRSYSLKDCLKIHDETGIPIILDSFHHECLNNGETMDIALERASKTWRKGDGVLMVDYSSQRKDGRVGTHTESIDLEHFKKFLKMSHNIDFDIMLEIKDKEMSALRALKQLG